MNNPRFAIQENFPYRYSPAIAIYAIFCANNSKTLETTLLGKIVTKGLTTEMNSIALSRNNTRLADFTCWLIKDIYTEVTNNRK